MTRTGGVRVCLALWTVLCATVFAMNLGREWSLLARVCPAECVPPRLGQAAVEQLAEIGLSLETYASLSVGVAVFLACVTTLLALLIALRGKGLAASTVPFVLIAIAASSALSSPEGEGFEVVGSRLIGTVSVAGMFWLFAAFPDLQLRPRWVVVPLAIAVLWSIVVRWVVPVRDGILADAPPWSVLEGVVFSAAMLATIVAQAMRFRRASPLMRRQLGVVLLAVAVLGAVGVAGTISTATTGGQGSLAGAAWFHVSGFAVELVLASIALALVRYRAFGVENVVGAGLTAGVVSLGFVAVYAGVVVAASFVLGGVLPPLLATFIAAAGLAVALPAVSRWVRGLIRGPDESPQAIAAALFSLLGSVSRQDLLLVEMAALLRERVHLGSVEIREGSSGQRADPTLGPSFELPLLSDGSQLGSVIARGPRASAPSRRARRALRAAREPVLAALASLRLNAELARSRGEVLSTREDERRSLRRQLHDEIVPSLAIVRHRISAAKGGTDADVHLDSAERTIDATVEQLRSLVRALRPTVLDEGGLAAGIESFAAGMATPVSIETRIGRELPALTELAAYRVAVEALLNAERHARASAVRLELRAEPAWLFLLISDDGIGFELGGPSGEGFASMRSRTAEAGGELSVRSSPGSGTRVSCRLPLELEAV